MEEEYLLSYLKGELSEQDSRKVEEWAACSDANRRCLEQICYIDCLAGCAEAYEAADVDAALAKFRRQVAGREVGAGNDPEGKMLRTHGSFRLWWRRCGVAVAAFFSGLILAAGILLGTGDFSSVYEVSTLPGQRVRVILPDGTAVWLNSSTELSYKSGWGLACREAYLKGEAYFEVKKNSFRPFVVHTQGVRTEVLGTKFNVRSRKGEGQVVTTLLQGKVCMYTGVKDEQGTRLSPGETFCVDVKSGASGLHAFGRPEEVLLWIKGEMHFDDEPLETIMECLSKVYNVRVSFADNRLKSKRFTCQFKTDSSLDEVLSTLAMTHHFSYEHEGTYVLINPVD